jgi:DNA-damage-inducible protein D
VLGNEYWAARDLARLLEYKEWRNFTTAIVRAKEACKQSDHTVSDHFVEANKMVKLGSGSQRKIEDYRLSRYACYLIVQNADPDKPIVALGQTYFAVQIRRQEIIDELALTTLPEDQKRLIFRSLMSTYNIRLAETAQHGGVIEPQDFATFQDHGYMGKYHTKSQDAHRSKTALFEKKNMLDMHEKRTWASSASVIWDVVLFR